MAKFFALVSFSSLLLLLFLPPLLFLMLGQPEYGTDQKSTRANQFLVIYFVVVMFLVLFLPDQVSSFVVVPPYAARLIQAEYGPGQKSTQAILSFLQKL